MTAQSDISVLIVAFRSRKTILACLAALEAQTCKPRDVLLLENGSPEGERVQAEDVPGWVTFVESDENLGFAGGNNLLARQSSGSWIALLNPDAYPEPDWLEALQAATHAYPQADLFGSTQWASGTDHVLDGTGDVYHFSGLAYRSGYGKPASALPEEGEVFAPCAAAMLIRREVFEALGGFDESFFCYNEDVDLGYRARLQGRIAIQLRSAVVTHDGYGSSGRRSEFATYYGVRNRLWVFIKNTPGWLFWLLLPVHMVISVLLFLSSLRFGLGGVFARAIRDGVRDLPRVWAQRRATQEARTASVLDLARTISWNPLNLLTRAAHIWRPSSDQEQS
ncbi:MAG: glycosyltransferase family 2 protein [Alphaproteobacteria bacterium]|nr:glycosyltransferase family 2 protein [Alphaproteobacteria bacterium]